MDLINSSSPRITVNRTGNTWRQTGCSAKSSLLDRKQHKRNQRARDSSSDSSFEQRSKSVTMPKPNGAKSSLPVTMQRDSSSSSSTSSSLSSSSDSETEFQHKTKTSVIAKPTAKDQSTSLISRQSVADISRPKVSPGLEVLPNQPRAGWTSSAAPHPGKKKISPTAGHKSAWSHGQKGNSMQQPMKSQVAVSSSNVINKTCSKARASTSQQTHKTHIHFDSSKSEDEQEETLHKSTDSRAMAPLVSVSPKNACKDVPTRRTSKVQSKPRTVGGHRDVVTHKSTIYVNGATPSESKETERMEQQANEGISNQPQLPLKDYSTYPLLQGPPRVGDVIAFKVPII